MDLKKLKEVINSDLLTDKQKEDGIYVLLAMDEKCIPTMLNILNKERSHNKETISDLNLLLSKSHVLLKEPKLKKSIPNAVEEIDSFYESNTSVKHCFDGGNNE